MLAGRAEPFDLVGPDDATTAVVCVHGFTGTPHEMRFLGERLADSGFHVRGVLLPGHGTTPDDLDHTTWRDWAGAVEAAFDELRGDFARVAVVGQSLGGLLSLELASRRPEVAAVASLAAPLWLDGLSGKVAQWAASGGLTWLKAIPKLLGSDCRDPEVRRTNPGYRSIPLKALAQLAAFMKVAEAALDRITQPVLVIHGKHDHTAPVACATEIARRTHARRTKLLERSYHLVASDVERDIVAEEVRSFLRQTETPER
ncbi:MAG: alpha/beta fold hydrolase [Deltaproteobacteria bacterium]